MKKLKTLIEDRIPFYNNLVLPYHLGCAMISGVKYGFPGRKLRVIGVTGTNGKTTTCFMIWKMLNMAGHKTGLMTTVGWGMPGMKGADAEGVIRQVEHMTTADVGTLNQRIEQIRAEGAEFLVLEVTSHAMVQFRTLGIPIEIAVMTNVTHEHLDYHKTFDNYLAAKCKLFKKARFGVINSDDVAGVKFAENIEEYITYGIKTGEMKAKEIKLSAEGVEYSCGDMRIKTQIPGKFNVYNSLAAVCVGKKLGLTDRQVERGIKALGGVEGRMNRVEAGQKFDVIVDYAHTPDAVQKVFDSVGGRAVKNFSGEGVKGRIITVTGGAGRRDETTRAERGEIVGENSDIFVVTEDDSRDEEPAEIAEMFVLGAEKAGMRRDENLFVELSRKKAIEKAIQMAQKGDLVLILGKGHEKTILRADGPHKFEDLKVTREILKKIKNKK